MCPLNINKAGAKALMKNFSLLLLLVLLTKGYSQKSEVEIDREVVAIQKSLSTYERVEQVRTATAFREVYFRDKDVCFVRVRSMEEQTDKEVSWYFLGGQLVYCETNWVDFRGISTFSENYYLFDNQLISWTENNQKIKSDSDKFKARAGLMTAVGEELLSKVQTR